MMDIDCFIDVVSSLRKRANSKQEHSRTPVPVHTQSHSQKENMYISGDFHFADNAFYVV